MERVEEVEWHEETDRGARTRVRDYTCGCQGVAYELCCSGGLMFVRRLDGRGEPSVVMESAWLVTREAERLWEALMAGLVR